MAADTEMDWDRGFAHGILDWMAEIRLTARELAMLRVMDAITDKPGWDVGVFDEAVAAEWEREARASEPLTSRRSWAWCLEELRDKAVSFARDGRVLVFDAGSRVSKSTVGERTVERMKTLVDRLVLEQDEGDRTGLRDLVDPSLHPLVHGRTKILPRGQDVSLDNLWDKLGQGVAVLQEPFEQVELRRLREVYAARLGVGPDALSEAGHADEEHEIAVGDEEREQRAMRARELREEFQQRETRLTNVDWSWRYSHRFQWLPCEVAFVDEDNPDGKAPKVRITSYISDLHPKIHYELYSVIEHIISASVGPWNDVLMPAMSMPKWIWQRLGYTFWTIRPGRTPPRIRTFGTDYRRPVPPSGCCWLREDNFYRQLSELADTWEALDPGERDSTLEDIVNRMDAAADVSIWPGRDFNLVWEKCSIAMREKLERFRHPEPYTLFSYQEWKTGKGARRPIRGNPWVSSRKPSPAPAGNRDDDEYDILDWLESDEDEDGERLTQGNPSEPLQDHCYRSPSKCPHCRRIPCPCSDNSPCSIDRHPSPLPDDNDRHYDHHYRDVNLQQTYKDRGLRVYVHIQSVDLAPENSLYDGSPWSLGGMLNERIVASSMYAFDVDNVVFAGADDSEGPPRVYFRMAANFWQDSLHMGGSSQSEEFIRTFAIDHPSGLLNHNNEPVTHLQDLGSSSLPQGRLLTFPNIVQSRLGPLKLRDASRPGRFRFLTVHLADPELGYNIISTARVVPQSARWWMRDVFPARFLGISGGLPPELVYQVAAEAARGSGVFGREEEKEFREGIMEERRRMMEEAGGLEYSFGFFWEFEDTTD